MLCDMHMMAHEMTGQLSYAGVGRGLIPILILVIEHLLAGIVLLIIPLPTRTHTHPQPQARSCGGQHAMSLQELS